MTTTIPNIKYSSWLLLASALCTGCMNIKLTKPLCGPGSPDNAPLAGLPAGAEGCYQMRQSAESRFSNEGNLMISSSDEMSYIELKRNVPTDAVTVTLSHGTMRALRHNIHNFGLSEPGVPAGYPMCHFPNMDQNSRILMSDDNGLNGFQEVTFVIGGVGVGSILARGLDPSLKTLQDAGLRFAIIDKISSDNKDRTQLIDSSDRTIVVNNDNIPGEEIIRTIVTSADNLLFKLDKVDPALCKGQKMTILSGR